MPTKTGSCSLASSRNLAFYTVFSDPEDHPGRCVVRRFVLTDAEIFADPKPLIVADSVEACRAAIPAGLVRMVRDPSDVQSVVETWL